MSNRGRTPWIHLLEAMEDDLLAAPDAVVVSEAAKGEASTVRELVARRLARAQLPAQRRRLASRLPVDPTERRALLKRILARPTSHRLAVGFSEARDLPDKDVQKLLRLLLAADPPDDPI